MPPMHLFVSFGKSGCLLSATLAWVKNLPLRRVTLNSFDYEAGPLCQSDAPKIEWRSTPNKPYNALIDNCTLEYKRKGHIKSFFQNKM